MEIFLFLYIKGVGVGGVLCTNFDTFLFLYIKGVFCVLILTVIWCNFVCMLLQWCEYVCLYAGPVIRCKLSVKKILDYFYFLILFQLVPIFVFLNNADNFVMEGRLWWMCIDNPDKVFQSLEMTEWVATWANEKSQWLEWFCLQKICTWSAPFSYYYEYRTYSVPTTGERVS